MINVKKMLGVTLIFLCLGLLAAMTEIQPLHAADIMHQPAQAPDAGQATGVPVLLSPVDGAVTTGTTNPPVGVPSLVWSTVAEATKYNVQISLSAGFASPVIDVTTAGLSFTPLTALADGIYFWRVSAFNKEWGAFSTPRTFTKDWSAGGALTPQLLSPTDGADRTAFAPTDFSWQPMIGAATYLFEICPDTNFTAVTYSATTITPNHTPPQRLATNTYFWRVTPVDAQGHAGRPSNINRFTFRWNIAPELIAPEDGLQTSFVPTFTWTAVEGAKTYRVQVDTESDFPSPTLYTAYNTAFVWEQNLSNDAEYFWRVQVVDDAGNTSDWSSTRSFRMRWNFKPQLLAPPNNSLTQSYPVFSWTPIPGIERYQIQVDESLSFATPLFDSKIYNNHTATITQFKESTIFLKTAYYWRVRGIDAQDNLTPWSDISTFEFDYTTSPNPVYPLPYALPDSITLPVHDDHTVAWPLFVWDTAHAWPQDHLPALARAADYYILTLSTDPSFVMTPTFQITTAGLAATPTTQNPLTKFDNNQLYYWRVRAMRNGQPMGSDTVRLTRIDLTLAKLQETQLISPTYPPDGFEAVGDPPVLGWTPVRGAANYKIELSHDHTFSTIEETAYPLFANYVPWQGKLTRLPFGSYWWRVRAESAPEIPLGSWSVARHFNLSVGIATGNKYDFVPESYPNSLLTIGTPTIYSPTLSLVATNTLPAGDQSMVNNLHMILNRVNLRSPGASNLDWVIAFSTSLTIETALQYGIYIDVDHVQNSGAPFDPEQHQIIVDSFYRPEYVIYIDRDPVKALGPQQIRLYKWNGLSWNPAQPLNAISGDAWYDSARQAVQLVVPYTAIGAGDEDFSGSLALTVFSTQVGAGQPSLDRMPATRNPDYPILDNPVFVSDMPLPLYPFNTPLSNPTIYYDLPTLRWRTPYFDSVDGYQLQVARDAKFTDIVETWEISEQNTAYFFGVLPAAFQSLLAYGDNESYYWRVRIRHERYDTNVSHFDYSFWSPPMRFKLASRVVGTPSVSTGAQVSTTPVFWWDRVEAAAGYTIQIDNDANFSNPEVNKKIDPNAFTLLDPLADGVWYWRVAIRRSDTVRGAWTPTLSFVKHSLNPSLLSPANEAMINTQPTFQWTAILTPTVQPRVATPRYQLQIAADPNFSTPKTYETAATSFTLKPVDSLSDGTWYWRVAPIDGKGNVGTYSPGQRFYKEYWRTTLLVPAQGITVTGAISFQWSPLTGTASYEFELDDDPLFNSPLKAKTDNTEYTPIDAIPPKQYYWRVRMADADRQVGPFPIEVGVFILKANKIYLPVIRKQ